MISDTQQDFSGEIDPTESFSESSDMEEVEKATTEPNEPKKKKQKRSNSKKKRERSRKKNKNKARSSKEEAGEDELPAAAPGFQRQIS